MMQSNVIDGIASETTFWHVKYLVQWYYSHTILLHATYIAQTCPPTAPILPGAPGDPGWPTSPWARLQKVDIHMYLITWLMFM